MSVQHFTHLTQREHELALTLYGAEQHGPVPCLIYVHGFKGFKDWAFVPYVGQFFAQHGYSFLAFNFSHNGIGPDGESFTELDRFERNTFLLEVEELEEVITQVAHNNLLGADLSGSLGLMGHSRGGGIALLGARNRKEVKAVATWSSVSTFDRYSKEQREAWQAKGHHEVVNARTGQTLRLGLPILQEVQRFAQTKLNILQASQDLKRPLLIVHGQADETVPYYEAEQLNIYGDPGLTSLRLIPQTGHTLGAKHPFEGSTPALDTALQTTLEFFDQHLK